MGARFPCNKTPPHPHFRGCGGVFSIDVRRLLANLAGGVQCGRDLLAARSAACLRVGLRICSPDPLADEHGGVSLLGVCVVHACAGERLVDLGDGCFDLALGCVPLVQYALEVG